MTGQQKALAIPTIARAFKIVSSYRLEGTAGHAHQLEDLIANETH